MKNKLNQSVNGYVSINSRIRFLACLKGRQKVDGVRFWACAMVGGLILQASSGFAEVRVYELDPVTTKHDVSRGNEMGQAPEPSMKPVEASQSAFLPSVTTAEVSDSAYVAALQLLTPKEYKLGTARVFIVPDDLSEELVDRLKQLKALEELHTEVYFQDVKADDLVRLFSQKIKEYPPKMEFNVDFNGTLANELQVKGKNMIVYTDAKGQQAQFGIESAYSFRTAIEKIKTGVAN